MNIYIDFDGTLFNTNLFYKDFLKLCSLYNVSEKDVIDIKGNELFNLERISKSIKDKYNLDNTFIDKVNSLYDAKYLYDDVIPFLEKYYLNNNLYIFTYGDKEYQINKINCCNITKYFKGIIITIDKSKEDVDYQNGLFIDNSPLEISRISSAGASNIIRIKREDDPYSKMDSNVTVKEFFDLSSIDVL